MGIFIPITWDLCPHTSKQGCHCTPISHTWDQVQQRHQQSIRGTDGAANRTFLHLGTGSADMRAATAWERWAGSVWPQLTQQRAFNRLAGPAHTTWRSPAVACCGLLGLLVLTLSRGGVQRERSGVWVCYLTERRMFQIPLHAAPDKTFVVVMFQSQMNMEKRRSLH